jgi:two-component system LytT family sensor kinase
MNGRAGSSSRMQPFGKRGWTLYALAWLPAVFLYSLSTSAQPDVTWWQATIAGVVLMGYAALAGVLVWRLAGRVTPVRPYIRFALVHSAAAVLYSASWLGVLIGYLALVAPAGVARQVLREAGLWQFSTGIYVYALLAGFFYLVRTQRQLREREAAAARAESAAAHAQLQTLRAQLNPHFLFNALHAVGALLRTDPAGAERALERIGDLLRRSLDHTARDLVPLGQEWEFVRGYLELEQLRHGDRLRLEYTLDPLALSVPVPALVLQPLVENAVRHAIAPRPQGGTIRIQAARANGTLTLVVADDGPGAQPRQRGRAGFGLEGVRAQLEGRYGAAAQMTIETETGHGFKVTLSIPIDG